MQEILAVKRYLDGSREGCEAVGKKPYMCSGVSAQTSGKPFSIEGACPEGCPDFKAKRKELSYWNYGEAGHPRRRCSAS